MRMSSAVRTRMGGYPRARKWPTGCKSREWRRLLRPTIPLATCVLLIPASCANQPPKAVESDFFRNWTPEKDEMVRRYLEETRERAVREARRWLEERAREDEQRAEAARRAADEDSTTPDYTSIQRLPDTTTSDLGSSNPTPQPHPSPQWFTPEQKKKLKIAGIKEAITATGMCSFISQIYRRSFIKCVAAKWVTGMTRSGGQEIVDSICRDPSLLQNLSPHITPDIQNEILLLAGCGGV